MIQTEEHETINQERSERIPKIYEDESGNAGIGRARHLGLDKETARIVEVVEGRQNKFFFSRIYETLPAVIGLTRFGNGQVVRIPFNHQAISQSIDEEIGRSHIKSLSKTSIEMLAKNPDGVQGAIYHKIWIYNLDGIQDAN